MATIQPFKALRPQPQLAKQVASRPYDVLSSAEAKTEAQGNPNSFLHITKSEIDLPETVDVHDALVYEQAKKNLAAFVQRDILFRESKECYYIYQLVMDGRAQTGLVCVSSVDDYEKGLIKKHEFTRPEKEQDRINHIKTSGAQTGNVFLAYRNHEGVDALIKQWKETKSPVRRMQRGHGSKHIRTLTVERMKNSCVEKCIKAFQSCRITRCGRDKIKTMLLHIPWRRCRINIINSKPDKVYK